MKKIAGLLAAIFVSLTAIAANPDFAYPKTTLEKALKHYDVALKTPDNSGIELIKSLLEIAGATAAIDPDSISLHDALPILSFPRPTVRPTHCQTALTKRS